MNERPVVPSRVLVGLIVLTLGVLWTLDNLGMLDASRIIRWWPLVALGWGLIRLLGIGVRRRVFRGAFWTIIGGVSLLNTLDVTRVTVFDLWPVFLLVIGASLVLRGWRGTSWISGSSEAGTRLNATAIMAGMERKVVSQEFRGGDVTAVLGGLSVDFRSARLAESPTVVDVFAMWGGIDLVVPEGWRVVGEVTPILGAFQDTTTPPTDPAAPTLVVRGEAVMGGIEVMHEERLRKRFERVAVDPKTGEPTGLKVGPGGVIIGGFRSRRARRGIYGIAIGPTGITVQQGTTPAPSDAPPAPGERPTDEA